MKLTERGSPRGLLRWFLRMPLWLYRLKLGWILGQRFLLLTHTGRKSGLPRKTVLEVVDHEDSGDVYFVASGWGERSQWFRNIQKTPQVAVQVGARSFEATAKRLAPEDAADVLARYAKRHPSAFRALSKTMVGEALGGSREECLRAAQSVPLVELRPKAK
jgi:deazaflavin-dependent oxidoreductase (nitroreductase family)